MGKKRLQIAAELKEGENAGRTVREGSERERALRADRKIKCKYLWDGEECLPGRVYFIFI